MTLTHEVLDTLCGSSSFNLKLNNALRTPSNFNIFRRLFAELYMTAQAGHHVVEFHLSLAGMPSGPAVQQFSDVTFEMERVWARGVTLVQLIYIHLQLYLQHATTVETL